MSTRLKKLKNSPKSGSIKGDEKTNIFSMIKFYESIPDYDTIRHLSCYDFLERLNAMKTAHMSLAYKVDGKISTIRPKSAGVKGRRKSARNRKCINSASKFSSRKSPGLDCNKRKNLFDEIECRNKRSSTSNSSNTTNLSKSCGSIQDKLMLEDDPDEKHSHRITPSPILRSPIRKIQQHINKNHYHNLYNARLTDNIEDHIHHRNFHNFHHNHIDDYLFDRSLQKPSINDFADHKKINCRMIESPVADHPNRTVDEKSQNPVITCRHLMKRAKSCPKDWISNYFAPSALTQRDDIETFKEKQATNSQRSSSRNSESRNKKSRESSANKSRNKIVKPTHCERKSPSSSNGGDECLRETQMVRTNLAAKLRQQWSRRKLMQMSNDKINSVMSTIPKCHKWNVRKSPAWQSFNMEDTTTEKFIREMARKEEQKIRQQAHSTHMNRMRQRVSSAQLLLEGRALLSKYK